MELRSRDGQQAGPRLAGFDRPSGRDRYLTAYQAALALWPVPHRSELLESRFGATHALVSGPAGGRPLILLPAALGVGALQWHENIARLAACRRVFALDFIGGPGRGTQTRPLVDRADCAQWLLDVLDELGADDADAVGSSQGGWFALNLAMAAPERVHRVGALAPAASLLPFRKPVAALLRVGPHLPARSARYSLRASLGGRYRADDRLVEVVSCAQAHFRYQQQAVLPGVFDDDELRPIGPRALVLLGEKEIIYDPVDALDRAWRVLPGATLELVPDAGHLLNLERADLVDDRLVRFLDSDDQTVHQAEKPGAIVNRRRRASMTKSQSVARRVSNGALRAGRSAAPMHGLIEVDVSRALALRAALVPKPSITALVVASVARVAAQHPSVHSYRDWRGRLVTHDHVDVNTLVEITTTTGHFPLATLVRDADVRSVEDITDQLESTKLRTGHDREARILDRVPSAIARLPGLISLLYWSLGRTVRGRSRSGTISVSAVGMFGEGGGFGIGPPTLYSLAVVVGGLEDRPRVSDGQITTGQMLDLTVTFDHNIIDGAPAARFIAQLRETLQRGDALDSP